MVRWYETQRKKRWSPFLETAMYRLGQHYAPTQDDMEQIVEQEAGGYDEEADAVTV
jgi:hypothetical protein